jgi:hypothetical protein
VTDYYEHIWYEAHSRIEQRRREAEAERTAREHARARRRRRRRRGRRAVAQERWTARQRTT